MPEIKANLDTERNNTRLSRIETETPAIIYRINTHLNKGWNDIWFSCVEYDDPRCGASLNHDSVWFESLDKALDQFREEGWYIKMDSNFSTVTVRLYVKKPTLVYKIKKFMFGVLK